MKSELPFHLNNLKVLHHRSPMKIGTDALLLGAYPKVINEIDTILEIGSGCGIISMMTALQHPESRFLGIDIDESSVEEFKENLYNNQLDGRCDARCIGLIEYSKVVTNQYDVIISNPPFFTSEMLPKDHKSRISKHTTTLSLQEIVNSVNIILKEGGLFYVILPVPESEAISQSFKAIGFAHIESLEIRSFFSSPFFRRIQVFSKGNSGQKLILKQLTIYRSKRRNDWTDEYKKLLQEFKNF